MRTAIAVSCAKGTLLQNVVLAKNLLMQNPSYYEILFMNLVGRKSQDWSWYMTGKEAYGQLKNPIRQDFGFDIGQWKAWLVENGCMRKNEAAGQ